MGKIEKPSGLNTMERSPTGDLMVVTGERERAEFNLLPLPSRISLMVYNVLELKQTQTQPITSHLAAGFSWLWSTMET